MIAAVLFDLDDTCYPQSEWLQGAFDAVAAAGAAMGADRAALRAALRRVAAGGSDQGRIIDRALKLIGAGYLDVPPLVEAFLAYRAPSLSPYPGLLPALARLRRRLPVALVSDGAPAAQRAKLTALGLGDAFDVVVLSDELGRAYRKPHPAPFLVALDALGVRSASAVFVGDRPDKDIVGSQAVGIPAVRVRTGEYAKMPDRVRPWASASDVVEAIRVIARRLDHADPRLGQAAEGEGSGLRSERKA